jgi:hypothetical protein
MLKIVKKKENWLVFIESHSVFLKTVQFPIPLSTAARNISSKGTSI